MRVVALARTLRCQGLLAAAAVLLGAPGATGRTMTAVPIVEQAGVPFVLLAGAVDIEPVKKWPA